MRLTSYAEDLARSNPALLLLLANRFGYNSWSDREVVTIIAKKQHEILHALGFGEATSATARFLAKIRAKIFTASASVKVEFLLRLHIHRKGDFPLHVPVINHHLLEGLNSAAYLKDFPMFQKETSKRTYSHETLFKWDMLYADAIRLGERMQLPGHEKILARAKSFAHLERIHDRWARRYRRRGYLEELKKIRRHLSVSATARHGPCRPYPECGRTAG